MRFTTCWVRGSIRTSAPLSQSAVHTDPKPVASPSHGSAPIGTTAVTRLVAGSIRCTVAWFATQTAPNRAACQSGPFGAPPAGIAACTRLLRSCAMEADDEADRVTVALAVGEGAAPAPLLHAAAAVTTRAAQAIETAVRRM